MTTEPILVWRFEDAPEQLRALSPHGGDEDWLVEVPPGVLNCTPLWLERIDTCLDPSEHPHPFKEGWVIYIGAHA